MKNYLVIFICNKGYADEVITVARNHGAKGGTVLTGRGTARQDDSVFFQHYIEREKEVLFIILDESNKQAIVDSVEKELGPNTDAHAVACSLDVESLSGFSNLK